MLNVSMNPAGFDSSLVLFQMIHEDDKRLLVSPDASWFRALYYLDWKLYQKVAAMYYDALYTFNLKEKNKAKSKRLSGKAETKKEAKIRLLFDRVTMAQTKTDRPSVLFEGSVIEPLFPSIDTETLYPGHVPERSGGKKAKCFFALFKSFVGVSLMGFAPEPELVHRLLQSNPSFVRVCGFVLSGEKEEYYYKHIPSLRKLEQFDQIMREFGIWNEIKLKEVCENITSGLIQPEDELVGDTTHYFAYSGFETVAYQDEKGNEKKKSQSKTTKACRCSDWKQCPHPWVLADEGAGTVCKSNKKMYWAHKASVIGLPKQGIPLDAAAVSDAATNDGETFLPHVKKLFEELPQVKPWVKRVLYDSACDFQELKHQFQEELQVQLKASLNPRRKKEVTQNLPRGMEKITPYGNLICRQGYDMDYQGVRFDNEKFIYQAPKDEDGNSVCLSCPLKNDCCPNAENGRIVNLSFDKLSHIDPNDPPMAKRFKAILSRRPSVERMIKRLKCDLSAENLTKRGNPAFQAYLDKSMIAFHILIRQT